MIICTQLVCRADHRLTGGKAARIRHRVGTGKAAHVVDFGKPLIMRHNNSRRSTTGIPHCLCHGRSGLANSDNISRRIIKPCHRLGSDCAGMASLKCARKSRAGSSMPAGQRHDQPALSGSAKPAAKARAFSTTFMPMATRVSSVADPRCGNSTVFGADSKA